MERHEILELMRKLKLAGMRAAFDEVLATGLKRQHSLQQIIGDLLQRPVHRSAMVPFCMQGGAPWFGLGRLS